MSADSQYKHRVQSWHVPSNGKVAVYVKELPKDILLFNKHYCNLFHLTHQISKTIVPTKCIDSNWNPGPSIPAIMGLPRHRPVFNLLANGILPCWQSHD